jgi:hypothetical protein
LRTQTPWISPSMSATKPLPPDRSLDSWYGTSPHLRKPQKNRSYAPQIAQTAEVAHLCSHWGSCGQASQCCRRQVLAFGSSLSASLPKLKYVARDNFFPAREIQRNIQTLKQGPDRSPSSAMEVSRRNAGSGREFDGSMKASTVIGWEIKSAADDGANQRRSLQSVVRVSTRYCRLIASFEPRTGLWNGAPSPQHLIDGGAGTLNPPYPRKRHQSAAATKITPTTSTENRGQFIGARKTQ